jgi:hypothetical protein
MLAEFPYLVGRRSVSDCARDCLLGEPAARATQIHPKVFEGAQECFACPKQERFCRIGRHTEHDRRFFRAKAVDVVKQQRSVVTIVECLQRLLDTAAQVALLPLATARSVEPLVRLAESIIDTSGALVIPTDADRHPVER